MVDTHTPTHTHAHRNAPTPARSAARTQRSANDSGMSTAEYAVGTVAACAFGGVLFKVVTSSPVAGALSGLIERALSVAF